MILGLPTAAIVVSVGFFSSLVLVSGLTLLSIGLLAFTNGTIHDVLFILAPIMAVNIKAAAGIAVGAGITLCIACFVGCFGMLRALKSVVALLIITTGVLMCLQMVLGTLALIYKAQISADRDKIRDALAASAREIDTSSTICSAWITLQENNQCCGPAGVPLVPSKCFPSASYCQRTKRTGIKCVDKVEQVLLDYCILLVAVGFGVMALEAIAVLFAANLCNELLEARRGEDSEISE